MITNTTIEAGFIDLLINHSEDMADIIDAAAAMTAWERVARLPELLYAVRNSINQAWVDHMLACFQLTIQNQFAVEGGQERIGAIMAAMARGEDHPEALPQYVDFRGGK